MRRKINAYFVGYGSSLSGGEKIRDCGGARSGRLAHKVIHLSKGQISRQDINIYIHMHTSSRTSLNRPTKGPTLSGPFSEVVGLGSWNISISLRLGPK